MDNKLLIQDLAEAIAIKEGLTKKKSEAFIKALFETIEEGLAADKFVKIKGLGTFKIISVGERESVNINTGERFSIEGHEKITFTPDTMLKDLVNRPFAHFQTVIINDETDIEEMESVDEEENVTEDGSSTEYDTDTTNEEVEKSSVESDIPSGEPENVSNPLPEVTSENSLEDNPPIEEMTKVQQTPPNPTETLKPEETAIEPEIPKTDTYSEPTTAEAQPRPTDDLLEQVVTTEDESSKADKVIDQSVNIPTPSEQISSEEEKPHSSDATTIEEEETSASSIEEDKSATVNEEMSQASEAKKEPNNESQQQIKYIIKELENKRNTWKTISLILLSVLLLILSYFAGYFRWFCPCETIPLNLPTQNNSCPVPIQKDVPVMGVDTLRDSILIMPKDSAIETRTVQKVEQEEKRTAPEKGIIPTETNTMKKERPKVTAPVEDKKKNTDSDPETIYRQVEGGKYKIVGTLRTHKIVNGETIRTIALDVYGSKGYALYIITHNDLENPNMVDTGTIIKLPKLERRKK